MFPFFDWLYRLTLLAVPAVMLLVLRLAMSPEEVWYGQLFSVHGLLLCVVVQLVWAAKVVPPLKAWLDRWESEDSTPRHKAREGA